MEIMNVMLTKFEAASATADPDIRFRRTLDAYLRFARERFPLYAFVMQDGLSKTCGSKAGKAVWNLLLAAPIATGCNEPIPGWDLHPLWTERLSRRTRTIPLPHVGERQNENYCGVQCG